MQFNGPNTIIREYFHWNRHGIAYVAVEAKKVTANKSNEANIIVSFMLRRVPGKSFPVIRINFYEQTENIPVKNKNNLNTL